jgi:hypothetical protein
MVAEGEKFKSFPELVPNVDEYFGWFRKDKYF